jgi:2-polyprenyl-3-methyl-5-hydroxy-6-metoxy-1,4-benzoquinol methylase
MLWLPDLSQRFTGPELMDNPEFQGEEMGRVLRNLKKINSLLGNYRNTLNALLSVIPQNTSELHIIDIGCGGGDLLCYLSKALKDREIPVRFTGIDFNPNITAHASKSVCNFNNIQFITADVLAPSFELPECDILISSHFVYRFSDGDLKSFVHQSRYKISTAIIFSELRRSILAYLLFSLSGRLMFKSEVTVSDGLTAIKRSFKMNELKDILIEFGIKATVVQRPIFRQIALVNFQ